MSAWWGGRPSKKGEGSLARAGEREERKERKGRKRKGNRRTNEKREKKYKEKYRGWSAFAPVVLKTLDASEAFTDRGPGDDGG